jgi:DNA-binding transcriptional LysR family regulator
MELSVQQLRALLALAQSETFCEAAKTANMPQSTLRVAIQQLERLLGFALLERSTTQALKLSAQAHCLMPSVQALDELWALAQRQLRSESGRSATTSLHVAGPIVGLEGRLKHALMSFHKHWPEVAIKLSHCTAEVALERMLRGEVDFAFGVGLKEPCSKGMSYRELEPTRFVVVLSREVGAALINATCKRVGRSTQIPAIEDALDQVGDVDAIYIAKEDYRWLKAAKEHQSYDSPTDDDQTYNDPTYDSQIYDDHNLFINAKACLHTTDSVAAALALLRKAATDSSLKEPIGKLRAVGQSHSKDSKSGLALAIMSESSARLFLGEDLQIVTLKNLYAMPRRLYYQDSLSDAKKLWFIEHLKALEKACVLNPRASERLEDREALAFGAM